MVVDFVVNYFSDANGKTKKIIDLLKITCKIKLLHFDNGSTPLCSKRIMMHTELTSYDVKVMNSFYHSM